MMNQDFLDALTFVSFVVGMANYNENLTQNDKDDIMRGLDQKTNEMLARIEQDLEEQNTMLREILKRIEEVKE